MASLSLDVDNLWSYLKTHGDAGWEQRPSYYDVFFPAVLDVLSKLDLRITFFVVGRDAAVAGNQSFLRAAVAAGHDIGNHSYEHEPWLHRYSTDRLLTEIADADSAIESATGRRPIGFRGPGFSWSPALLEILVDRGYLYDASTLPTYVGPLARRYYFSTARLSPEQRAERSALFGAASDGLRPAHAYRWSLPSGRALLEIPVTTIPILKTPFHLSYLLYLSRISEAAMEAYLRMAIGLCRMTGTEPSFLLHPLDLLGADQAPSLQFFPGMDLSGERKLALFRRVMGVLAEHYQIVDMETHARAILTRDTVLRPAGRSTATRSGTSGAAALAAPRH